MSEKLSKYITAFNYFDKFLIVLSLASGGISIASFACIIGAPIGIASASFSFAFSLTTESTKTYWEQHQIKGKSILKLFCFLGVNWIAKEE